MPVGLLLVVCFICFILGFICTVYYFAETDPRDRVSGRWVGAWWIILASANVWMIIAAQHPWVEKSCQTCVMKELEGVQYIEWVHNKTVETRNLNEFFRRSFKNGDKFTIQYYYQGPYAGLYYDDNLQIEKVQ